MFCKHIADKSLSYEKKHLVLAGPKSMPFITNRKSLKITSIQENCKNRACGENNFCQIALLLL